MVFRGKEYGIYIRRTRQEHDKNAGYKSRKKSEKVGKKVGTYIFGAPSESQSEGQRKPLKEKPLKESQDMQDLNLLDLLRQYVAAYDCGRLDFLMDGLVAG